MGSLNFICFEFVYFVYGAQCSRFLRETEM